MTEYVAGFVFANAGTKVLLIRKKRPEWQCGRLNGIGGHIEPGETPKQAIVREFREEAGVHIEDWRNFLTLSGNDWKVYFYECWLEELPGPFPSFKSMTDENIEWWDTKDIVFPRTDNAMPNLSWILPMALKQNMECYDVQERYVG